MDKPYYYLGTDRTAPKGPHTLKELSAMMLRGEVTPATEVAAEGDTRWQALGTLLMSQPGSSPQLPPIPEQKNALPPVPGFAPTMPQVPAPVIQPVPVPGSMWQDVGFALLHPFQWGGRALRREFWGTWLVYMLLCVPLTLVGVVVFCVGTAQALDTSQTLESWLEHPAMRTPWIVLGLTLAVMLYFWLVMLAVTIRRLHDIGGTGWLVIVSAVTGLAWQVLYFKNAWAKFTTINWNLILAIEDDASRNARLEETIQSLETATYSGWGTALYLLNLVLGIIIFVCVVTDSTKGTNKYGPSIKYPEK